MDTTIETPRLRLTLLQDTDLDSDHVKWYHEIRSDEVAMGWSIRGPTKSLPESRDFLAECLKTFSSISYIVHIKPSPSSQIQDPSPRYDPIHGELIGEIGLRLPPDTEGPTIPPPPPPAPATATTASASNPDVETEPGPAATPTPPLATFRILGYAFLPSSWGFGYATEANAAMLSAYGAYCRKSSPSHHYVEAGVDNENPASVRVVEKLGFERVGWHETDGPVFLAGKWREPGYWIYGRYV